MKISLNWLKDFIDFDSKVSLKDVVWRLTEATATIEMAHEKGKGLDHVVVGQLLSTHKHPNADHLHLGKVKVNAKDEIQVIYGEKAVVQVGDKIPVAIAPCELPGGKVETRVMRGEKSEGMLCLDSELVPGAPGVLTKFPKSANLGLPVVPLMMLEDTVLEIDNHSLTHRADLFSHIGFARECVALGLATWKKRSVKKVKAGTKALPMKISFENKKISKSYWGTAISGLYAKPSPLWMRRRLEGVGVRPINAIVDITNYVMMELGQPTHAFDLRMLEGKDFFMRLSKSGEKVKTLDGVERKLPEQTIVIESGGRIVDLAGIMGGFDSEIKVDTKQIYFHSSQFDNILIRRAMIALGHRTDGGTMHEKNIEPERSGEGFARGLELFKEIFPEAKFEYRLSSHVHEKSLKRKVTVSSEKMNRHLGIEIPLPTAKKYLTDLGFEVTLKKNILTAQVPAWRTSSIMIPEDLIEEIVRVHGYSKVPALPPLIELKTPVKNQKRTIRNLIQQFLVGKGFLEEANYSFLSEALLSKTGFTDTNSLLAVSRPVNQDFRFMRPYFFPYLLENIARNQLIRAQEWRTFEMGKSYARDGDGVREENLLNLLLSSPTKKTNFFDAKGIAEQLFKELSLPILLESVDTSLAYPGRGLRILSEEKVVGHIFEIHPSVLDRFKIRGSVSAVELFLETLYQLRPREIKYIPINPNPEALLDLSVMVESHVPMEQIQAMIARVEPQRLKRIEFLEVYEGESVGEGKKSFTFSLAYQDSERTLKEEEIQHILHELIKSIESKGGLVRR